MAALGRNPELLGFRRGREDRPAHPRRDDLISLAERHEQRRFDPADPPKRVERIAHQPLHRQEPVLLPRQSDHAGERRLQHHTAERPPRRDPGSDARAQALAIDDDRTVLHRMGAQELQRGGRRRAQGCLARRARIAAIARILRHQHAQPGGCKLAQPICPIRQVAAIAVQIEDDRAVRQRRRQPPAQQIEPIGGMERDGLQARHGSRFQVGRRHVRPEDDPPLQPVQEHGDAAIDQDQGPEQTQQNTHQRQSLGCWAIPISVSIAQALANGSASIC